MTVNFYLQKFPKRRKTASRPAKKDQEEKIMILCKADSKEATEGSGTSILIV